MAQAKKSMDFAIGRIPVSLTWAVGFFLQGGGSILLPERGAGSSPYYEGVALRPALVLHWAQDRVLGQ